MANPTGKPHNSILSISIHRNRQVFNIQTCRQNPQHAANERFIHPSLSISLSIGTSDACLLIALSPDIKELSTRSFLICSQIHSLYVTWLHKEQSGHLKPIIVQFLTLKKGYNQEPILMQTEESIQPAFTFFHMHNNNFVVHTKQINARQETTGAIQEHSIVTILHLWSRKVVNMAINLIARSHTYRPISYCQLPENSWPFSAIRDPLWLIILSPSISLGSKGKNWEKKPGKCSCF